LGLSDAISSVVSSIFGGSKTTSPTPTPTPTQYSQSIGPSQPIGRDTQGGYVFPSGLSTGSNPVSNITPNYFRGGGGSTNPNPSLSSGGGGGGSNAGTPTPATAPIIPPSFSSNNNNNPSSTDKFGRTAEYYTSYQNEIKSRDFAQQQQDYYQNQYNLGSDVIRKNGQEGLTYEQANAGLNKSINTYRQGLIEKNVTTEPAPRYTGAYSDLGLIPQGTQGLGYIYLTPTESKNAKTTSNNNQNFASQRATENLIFGESLFHVEAGKSGASVSDVGGGTPANPFDVFAMKHPQLAKEIGIVGSDIALGVDFINNKLKEVPVFKEVSALASPVGEAFKNAYEKGINFYEATSPFSYVEKTIVPNFYAEKVKVEKIVGNQIIDFGFGQAKDVSNKPLKYAGLVAVGLATDGLGIPAFNYAISQVGEVSAFGESVLIGGKVLGGLVIGGIYAKDVGAKIISNPSKTGETLGISFAELSALGFGGSAVDFFRNEPIPRGKPKFDYLNPEISNLEVTKLSSPNPLEEVYAGSGRAELKRVNQKTGQVSTLSTSNLDAQIKIYNDQANGQLQAELQGYASNLEKKNVRNYDNKITAKADLSIINGNARFRNNNDFLLSQGESNIVEVGKAKVRFNKFTQDNNIYLDIGEASVSKNIAKTRASALSETISKQIGESFASKKKINDNIDFLGTKTNYISKYRNDVYRENIPVKKYTRTQKGAVANIEGFRTSTKQQGEYPQIIQPYTRKFAKQQVGERTNGIGINSVFEPNGKIEINLYGKGKSGNLGKENPLINLNAGEKQVSKLKNPNENAKRNELIAKNLLESHLRELVSLSKIKAETPKSPKAKSIQKSSQRFDLALSGLQSNQQQGTRQNNRQRSSQSSSEGSLERLGLINYSVSRQSNSNASSNESSNRNQESTAIAQVFLQTQTPQEITRQVQEQKLKTPPIFQIPRNPQPPEKPTKREPPKEPPLFFINPANSNRNNRTSTSYSIFEKKGKSFLRVGGGLPLNRALLFGSERTKSNLGRTFKIIQSGNTNLQDISFRPNPSEFRNYKGIKNRKQLPFGQYIQRNALQTKTEQFLIQQAKRVKGLYSQSSNKQKKRRKNK